MPRHKSAKNCNVLPWLSSRQDNTEGRFVQLGNSLLLSHKDDSGLESNLFVTLSPTAKLVYLCMTMEAGGKKNFQFPLSAAKKYGIAQSTLRRSIDELLQAGFIKRQSGRTARLPNNYEFSLDWKKRTAE